jgi:hypothetical protein
VLGGRGRAGLRSWVSKIIVIDVDDWDSFVRKEAVVSFVEHMGGIIAEDWLCLYKKVSHHGVTILPTRRPFVAQIHVIMAQGHGASPQ